MRLEKYLSDCGIGTRSQCKIYIRQGLIKVNQEIVKNGAMQVTAEDAVCFRDEPLHMPGNQYYMFHKPAGCICATTDEKQKTVLEYFPKELSKKLVIVGRLDKDTEGILFLTNDGNFVHQMMSPKKHVEKTYYFRAYGTLPADAVLRVEQGIDIGDEKLTLPGKLDKILEYTEHEKHIVTGELTICEGRYHQVKRMLQAMECEVFYLKRLSIGKVMLDEKLAAGNYRELSAEELHVLETESRK